jgi:predicted phosphohydrolase
MILYSLSDVHLEFYKHPKQIERLVASILSSVSCKDAILLLCGDIGRLDTKYDFDKYHTFLSLLTPHFNKIVLVAGNHEYYGSSISVTNDRLRSLQKDRIIVLDNDVLILQSEPRPIAVIGTTLWGYCETLSGKNYVNDFRHITTFRDDPNEYNRIGRNSREWLTENIRLYAPTHNIIVMTHHLPSYELIDPRYADEFLLNPYYAQSMDEIFTTDSIRLWVYGHTHIPSVREIQGTRFVCNPFGYPDECNPKKAFKHVISTW